MEDMESDGFAARMGSILFVGSIFLEHMPRFAIISAMYYIVSVGLLLFLAGWLLSVYQRLSHYHGGAVSMWKILDAEVAQRHELLNHLSQLASMYIPAEDSALKDLERHNIEDYKALRETDIMGGSTHTEHFSRSEKGLQESLDSFFKAVDDYPELKAELPLSRLRHELGISSTRVSRALYVYNSAAQEYNAALHAFPGTVVAQICRFREASEVRA